MRKRPEQQLQKGAESLVKRAEDHLEIAPAQKRHFQALEFIGAAKAINKLTLSLSSQLLMALKKFQEEEGYKEYGCKTWVEFLQQNPELDMSKSQYYKLIGALENEGSEVFDLLNSLNIPLNARLQIGAGSIQIEGNDLLVNEQRVPLNDPRKLKRTLTQVIEQLDATSRKADKTAKENEKLKKKLDEAKEEARIAAMSMPGGDDTDPAHQAYLHVISSLVTLTRELNELPRAEADKRLEQYRPHISQAMEMCFAFSVSSAPTRKPDNDTGLSDSELADLMDEA